MANVIQRGKVWTVKLAIPEDVRHAFGGKTAVWKSLGTSDRNEAMRRAAPIIAALKDGFERVRGAAPVTHSVSPTHALAVHPAISPEKAEALIATWRVDTITRLRDEHWSGTAPTFAVFSDEAAKLSELRYRLDQPAPWGTIPDFRDRMADGQ